VKPEPARSQNRRRGYDVVDYFNTKQLKEIRATRPPIKELESAHRKKDIQIALRDRGYYAGAVDGYLGEQTRMGIQRFESGRHL
jgi:peptidoglycan hydrolase-like protein with peptidoglycan-binding domain